MTGCSESLAAASHFIFGVRPVSPTLSLSDGESDLALADDGLLLPEEVMEQVENNCLVQAEVFIAIPEVHRHVLSQKYIHGLSVHEIAVAMQLTAKAVESLLWRARGRLRCLAVISGLQHRVGACLR